MLEKNYYLTKDEVIRLKKKKEIGRGTDGRVIKISNRDLIKLYHDAYERIMKEKTSLAQPANKEEDDVKIYKIGSTKDYAPESSDNMRYYRAEEDGSITRLNHKEALERAIERREEIKRSKLPEGMVYIDGKLAGCTLIPQKGIPIHKLIGILPFKEKVIILLDVLKSVKELTDHYIYPIDLDNSPYTSKARYDDKPVGHSHVLVTLVPLKTNIIDLDGKSTIYTDFESKKFKDMTYQSFKRLMDEVLFEINHDNEYEPFELESIYYEKNVPEEYISKLIYGVLDHNDILALLENLIHEKPRARR